VRAVAVLVAVLVGDVTDARPSGTMTQEPTTPHPGRALLQSVCSSCHEAATITASPRTRVEWDDTLQEMVRYGAEASDEQFAQIRDYLLRNHSLVNVNKASAEDLEVALDTTRPIAAAVVTYRKEHGGFASIDDLKKVPGIDPVALDARAKRLRY
jgi:competence protein ComEA